MGYVAYRDLLLYSDESGDLVNDLLLDQRAVHVEDGEPLVFPEDVLSLQDDFHVPFPFEAPYTLVSA